MNHSNVRGLFDLFVRIVLCFREVFLHGIEAAALCTIKANNNKWHFLILHLSTLCLCTSKKINMCKFYLTNIVSTYPTVKLKFNVFRNETTSTFCWF